MQGRWDIQGGTLELREEGARVWLRASRGEDGRGLYKAWVQGRTGRYLLGTLAPGEGGLSIERRLSRGELERRGCWPVTGGEICLTYAFARPQWSPEPQPERVCREEYLKVSLRGRQGFLSRSGPEEVELAYPFRTDCPLPLTPLFCLARVEGVNGRRCIVWRFDRTGWPRAGNWKKAAGPIEKREIIPYNESNT